MTLDVLGLGDGGVVRVHVHGVTKGQAHLPAALCAQLVQPESCIYYVYYISVYIICILYTCVYIMYIIYVCINVYIFVCYTYSRLTSPD